MSQIRARVVDEMVAARLRTHGAVLLAGSKAVGKTTTARSFAASEFRLDQDSAALKAAQVDPHLLLKEPYPRLIDEYQLVDGMWNAVRGQVDALGRKGLFLLTGSATPEQHMETHSGVRRIATVAMRTMSLFERGFSTGDVSIGALLRGDTSSQSTPNFSVTDAIETLSVGGWPDNIGLSLMDALDANIDHLHTISEVDVSRVDGVKRDAIGVRQLIGSYARNIATNASLRTVARTSDVPHSEATLHSYFNALNRLFLIEDQPAWAPRLRSRVRMTSTPKRHLADPSLAVAALDTTPDRLLGPEIETAGFLFESQVVHDLRVYGEPHRATVRYYHDNKDLEVDAILEASNGKWIAIEIKLGHSRVEEAAKNLLALKDKLADESNALCGALVVVVAESPTYLRPDGVLVTSIASLGP